MYVAFFGFSQPPFRLSPDTDSFCALPAWQEALNVLLVALHNGEGFIKITGAVGSGKTLLCRVLLNQLHGQQAYAYIPNPDLTGPELLKHLAQELGVADGSAGDSLLTRIERQLLALARHGKSVVLLIDEAQAMPTATLESLRLLSNLETEQRKLLQIVLFGQSELDEKLARFELRQLRQRIAFSYQLPCLRRSETAHYVHFKLSRYTEALAPSAEPVNFSRAAVHSLHFCSYGVPRLVNLLCHKALLLAYGEQRKNIGWRDIQAAARDTESARAWPRWPALTLALLGSGLIGTALALSTGAP